MSRNRHTPPMPTHADLMLAEKLRRELGGEAASSEDADTQPENVTHLPAVAVADPNKQYAPLAAPPKRARVKTVPMANVIVGVTVPPQHAPTSRPPSSRRAETTAPGRASRPGIPMDRRGGLIPLAIVLAAGMVVSAIFVVGASSSSTARPTVATTTMATVAVPATLAAPATVANVANVATSVAEPEPLDVAPAASPRARPERSERPSPAQHAAARATTTPAVVEPAADNTKDDIERKIR